MANVGAILKAGLSTDVYSRVVTALNGPPKLSLSVAIENVLGKGMIPATDFELLLFMKNVISLCNETSSLVGWILSQLKEFNLQNAAQVLFPKQKLLDALSGPQGPPPSADTITSYDKVRSRFLDTEPLCVVLALLRAQQFTIEPGLTNIVDAMLTIMIRYRIGIDAPDLLSSVQKQLSVELDKQQVRIATEFITTSTILSRIAETAEHIPLLYNQRYTSIRSITLQAKILFVSAMKDAGMDEQTALKLHDRAQRIDCRNEQLWLALIQDQTANFLPVTPRTATKQLPDGRLARAKSNLTDIFGLEEPPCEECCSVTSLSAYFADLMGLLRSTRVPQSTTDALGPTETGRPAPTNLLEVLARRRADLQWLQLTCANSQVMIPYISFVNEVLESFIRYKAGKALGGAAQPVPVIGRNTPVDAYGEEGDQHQSGPISAPGNTDTEIYSKIISEQMFPFARFPYNQGRDTIINYFDLFQISYSEIVEKFTAPERTLQLIPPIIRNAAPKESLQKLDVGMEVVLQRQAAAEALQLSLADFLAITGESFFPAWFVTLFCALSKTKITVANPWSVATLWGYADAASMVDVTNGTGLSFVKRQLMRRSGLAFQDILSIVKTQCFGQFLVLTNEKGSAEFETSIEGVRLLANASQPPFGPLSEEICFNIQAFMRLQAKLKWSIKDVDAAIYCLRSRELAGSPVVTKSNVSQFFSISPFVIQGIAAISKISNLSGIEPASLLPLWGTIDSYGENSLLFRKFLTPSMQEIDKIFSPPTPEGEYLKMNGVTVEELRAHDTGICAGLKWPAEYFQELLTTTSLTQSNLDVETLSVLYRHVLICRILSVPPKDAVHFFELFFAEAADDPLKSPMATLSAIEDWQIVFDAGWTLEPLHTVLNISDDKSVNSPTSGKYDKEMNVSPAGVALARNIANGAKELKKSLSFLFATRTPTQDNLAECASRTFDAATAGVVISFIDGTQSNSEIVSFKTRDDLQDLLKTSQEDWWPRVLSVLPSLSTDPYQAEIKLTGVPSTNERQSISKTIQAVPSIKASVEGFVEKAFVAQTVLKLRFDDSQLAASILLKDWEDPSPVETSAAQPNPITVSTATGSPAPKQDGMSPVEVAEQELIHRERQVRARRRAFVDIAGPVIVQDLLETLIVNTVQTFSPELEVSTISTLLKTVVKLPTQDQKGQESAMTAIQHLCAPRQYVDKADKLLAYFLLTDSEVFTIKYVGDPARQDVKLKVNGIEMPLNASSKTWTLPRLTSGVSYLFQSDVPPLQLQWSTAKSLPSKFTDEMLLPWMVAKQAATIVDTVQRIASVCKTSALTTPELEYICIQAQQGGNFLAIDMNNLHLSNVVRLTKYQELRDQCRGKDSLVSLFTWLANPSSMEIDTLVAKIANSTGWKAVTIKKVLSSKYPKVDGAGLVRAMRDLNALLNLRAVVLFDDRLERMIGSASRPFLSTIFQLAEPRTTLAKTQDFEAAQGLQARMTPSQRSISDERLMGNQRESLVAYLLEQDYVRDKMKVWDADGLFDYFLIDVQMGPQLRTSRIKQAISVVQLFVQRCLLGMEEVIPKDTIVRERWNWMQQYTLWEAHRKLFLYPENWIDPTLRDDKSQLFQDFESSLMQKNLNINTFTSAVQTYLCGLNDISSLEIVAYLHDSRETPTDIFHFFGRTRTTPYAFYYRQLTIYRSGSDGEKNDVFWQPWKKIDMDIPSVEAEWNGSRLHNTGAYLLPILSNNRLFLFVPQLVAKPIPGPPETKKYGEMSNFPPRAGTDQRAWEMTMAWTEYIKGSWAPKRASAASLTVESNLPSASQFWIDPFQDGRILSLIVSSASAGQGPSAIVGRFDFCEDQIVPVQGSAPSAYQMLKVPSISFQKISFTSFNAASIPKRGDDKAAPLYFLDKKMTTPEDASWTLSKTSDRTTGLVVSAKHTGGPYVSYFSQPRLQLKGTEWTEAYLDKYMNTYVIDHTFSHELVEAAADRTEPLNKIYNAMSRLADDRIPAGFGAGDYALFHELGRPSALYNWEVGMHAVLLAVDRFASTQQYEEALQLARLVFDPTTDIDFNTYAPEGVVTNGPTNPAKSCWRFSPFRAIASKIAADGDKPPSLTELSKDVSLAIQERRSYGALVHAAARGRPQAYMKWIVMKYGEILIANGDVQFRKGTLESLPLAIQYYIEAVHILGPEPPKVPKLGNRKGRPLSFNDLTDQDVLFQLGLPFSPELRARGAAETVDGDPKRENMMAFVKTAYFCVPLNPKFKQIRNLVNQRLYNIRNSLDINGKPVIYALREPPIDPGALLALSGQGFGNSDVIDMILGDQNSPLPAQRFQVLLQRALELCAELRGFSDRFLTAIEKKESEAFSLMQAYHATAIHKLMLDIKQISLTEAQKIIETLQLNRDASVSQLGYYMKLIGESDSLIPKKSTDNWTDIKQDVDEPTKDDLRMSSYEKTEMDLADAALALNIVSSAIDAFIAPICLIPEFEAITAPLGVGISTTLGGGTKISKSLEAASSAIKIASLIVTDRGNHAARKGGLVKQLQERRLQANMIGREIKNIDKQIEVQQTRVHSVQKEIELEQKEVENAAQMEAWYRSKYTNEQLYGWMEKQLRSLYYQAYTLAMTSAQRAQSALSFEQGRKVSLLRPSGYWDSSRDGLLAADGLYLDLKRLEGIFLDTNTCDYQISKTVSLREIDPMALIKLRITGTTSFAISEFQYDTDFPGHYMRRIKSVAVTIPAIVGPYSGVNATLTLMEHKYRVDASASNADDYMSSSNGESFRTDRVYTSSAAISSGIQDAGVFELTFSGPEYIPFEGAGAISTWNLQLPTEIRKFDYETISDVLVHVQYTSLDGGSMLRAAANGAVRKVAQAAEEKGKNGGFWALWDLKNDFPDEWYRFSTRLLGGKGKDDAEDAMTLKLGNIKDRLPFSARSQPGIEVHSITLVGRTSALVTGLEVSAVPKQRSWTTNTVERSTVRTIDGLTEADLSSWTIQAPLTLFSGVKPKVEAMETVHMLINYVYTASGKRS